MNIYTYTHTYTYIHTHTKKIHIQDVPHTKSQAEERIHLSI